MKNLVKTILFIVIVSFVCTGCRGMVKYVDDMYNGVKRITPKPPKHLSVPKDCPYCEGGYYWFNGYQYQCSHCKGDGIILEQIY